MYLLRDTERLTWEFEKAETELWKEPADPILEEVAKVLSGYIQNFQERNPNLRVFSAHLHMDEATPH